MSDTSGTATSHQCPPASVVINGSVSSTMTVVAGVSRLFSSAASSSAIDFTGAMLIDQSVANATFNASGDIRFTGVVP